MLELNIASKIRELPRGPFQIYRLITGLKSWGLLILRSHISRSLEHLYSTRYPMYVIQDQVNQVRIP